MVDYQIKILIIVIFTKIIFGLEKWSEQISTETRNRKTRLETKSFGCICGKDPSIKKTNVSETIGIIECGWQGARSCEKCGENHCEDDGICKWNGKHCIFKGSEIVERQSPWFVYIRFKERHESRSLHCGGTLLNQKWVLTAAHCFCNDKHKKRKCKKNYKLSNPRLEVDNDIKDYATLYFGIHFKTIGKVDKRRFRRIKKVIIHPGFDIKDSNAYHDLALLEVDRPIYKKNCNWKTRNNDAIYPICLPDHFYWPNGKTSFVTGFGMETQDTCRTNGRGPEIYTTCAPGSILEHIGKTEKIRHYKENGYGQKVWAPGCINGYAPIKLDEPCYGFNFQNKEYNLFTNIDEVVLVPKNRTIEPKACYSTNTERPVFKNKAESSIGWCGTCIPTAKNNTPGYCGPGAAGSEANFVKIKSESGWGYCGQDCTRGSEWSHDKLKIIDQTILSPSECRKLLKGIKSKKCFREEIQLCSGNKIKRKIQHFLEYEGAGNELKFKHIKWIRNDDSRHEKFVAGLDFMIGGKESCKGNGGGPMWTREGEDKLAYLVGVVSAGAGETDCANLNSPALYTKITNYLSWIMKYASSGKCSSKTYKSKNKKEQGEEKEQERKKEKKNIQEEEEEGEK